MIFKKLKKNFALFLGLGMSTILATSIGLFTTACTTNSTSDGISARGNTLITDSETGAGLTTVEYDQEKWIGDNSVSIAIASTPNYKYLTSILSSYLETNATDKGSSSDSVKSNSYTLIYNLNQKIQSGSGGYSVSNITAGTGWLLDYSVDQSNTNLITYYLGTNMHVLNATYTISYEETFTVNEKYEIPYTVKATFPISTKSASSVAVYLSQPQYSTTSASDNLKIPVNTTNGLSTAWYKTPITIDDFNSSLIPLGAYNTTGTASSNTSSYDMEVSFYPTSCKKCTQTYYFSSDGSSGSSSMTTGTPAASDFSVLKFADSKSSFNKLTTTGTYGTVFTKIKEMFNVDTDDATTAKNSSYIARLNRLLTLTASESTYDKDTVDDLFMFADYNKDLNSKTILSTAGFPATTSDSTSGSTSVSYSYINFNSNTISYSLTTNVPTTSYSSRTSIEYNQSGKFYYSTYNWTYNLLMKNVNLLGGSSGSMTIDQDYKIAGIYWGTLTSDAVYGVTTRLYSYSDNASMINIWLKYVALNDKNSKLAQLFTNLKNLNYFN